jgi:YggT family protein
VDGLSILASILNIALNLFVAVMWVRLIVDLIASLNRGWRPKGLWLVIAEVSFVITDPPIKLVRKVIPPLRLGGASLDFAWSIVLLAAIILSYVVVGFLN